jgi:hypothetical protein
VQAIILHRMKLADFSGFFLKDCPGAIRAAVIHRDDLVWHAAKLQFDVQVFDGGRDAAFLIACWNHYRKQFKRRVRHPSFSSAPLPKC